jgi:hypothetical protein
LILGDAIVKCLGAGNARLVAVDDATVKGVREKKAKTLNLKSAIGPDESVILVDDFLTTEDTLKPIVDELQRDVPGALVAVAVVAYMGTTKPPDFGVMSLPRFSGHLDCGEMLAPERSPGWPHDTRQSSANGRWS